MPRKAIALMSASVLEQFHRVRQTAAVGDGEADACVVLAILRNRESARGERPPRRSDPCGGASGLEASERTLWMLRRPH
ncbi:hypothetical protein GCM10007886_54210 [Methylobacterium gregans]|nr:hypothetical protein GCM10007886_54210 [Methylobacterium gregans]